MKSLAKENQTRQERKNNSSRKEFSSFSSQRTEPKKTKSPTLGEIAEKFLRKTQDKLKTHNKIFWK